MKRKRSGVSGFAGPLFFLLLLLAPPVHRANDDWRSPRQPRELLRRTTAALEAARLRDSLRALRKELRDATRFDYDRSTVETRRRYDAFLARVLPFGDPSPLRRSLWVRVHGAGSLPADCAVAAGSLLVGRLGTVPLTESVARVQTLTDPGFRVKFRCGRTVGVLRGTGRHDPEGERRPLLEADHLSPLGDLPAGEPVVTAGGDGVYPPGILIGQVAERDEFLAGFPIVRAALSPEELQDVVVLVDRARRELGGVTRDLR